MVRLTKLQLMYRCTSTIFKPRLFVKCRVSVINSFTSSSCVRSYESRSDKSETLSTNKINVLLQSKKHLFQKKIQDHFIIDTKILLDTVCQNENLSITEWDTLKKELLFDRVNFNESNFGGQIMKVLLRDNNYSLAHSFLNYLENVKLQPNVLTMALYLELCGKNVEKCGENAIFDIYRNIKSEVRLNPTIMQHVVSGLCATSQWMEAFNILKESKHISLPPPAISAVACALFKHNNIDSAIELIQQSKGIFENVYIEWLDCVRKLALKNLEEAIQLFEKFVAYLYANEIVLPQGVANVLPSCLENFRTERWKVKSVVVDRNGICPNCNQHLEKIKLNEDQFKCLQEAIIPRLLEQSDIYLKSNPVELERFLKFIEDTIPYDIVIDGLNASYYNLHNASNYAKAQQLFHLVQHFFEKREMRVLVIGKKHMKSWPKSYMRLITSMAKVFFIENVSKDDPFILYAAMMSGLHTWVLTKDIFRDHKFWLKDPLLAKFFEQWRKSSQVFLTRIIRSNVRYQEPVNFNLFAQGCLEKGWHIPYDNGQEKTVFDIQKSWLCIKNK